MMLNCCFMVIFKLFVVFMKNIYFFSLIIFISGNGLLPDGTKPLSEPILTRHEWGPATFKIQTKAIYEELKLSMKFIYLKLLTVLQDAKELTHWGLEMHICINELMHQYSYMP